MGRRQQRFVGFLKYIKEGVDGETIVNTTYSAGDLTSASGVVELFDKLWANASGALQSAKSAGQLAIFVTSDLYTLYEKYLDEKGVDAAYTGQVEGREGLAYHGIPVIDLRVGSYLPSGYAKSFCFLTDRRNLVLAVNTADLPGNEVRMWYNPDEMENRQRAVFMAGCAILDDNCVSYASKA